ncbi:hypothetical protein Tco_0707893, partial [Tanacetum coccineum]
MKEDNILMKNVTGLKYLVLLPTNVVDCQVVKSTTIRAVLSLAVTNELVPYAILDIQNAFFMEILRTVLYLNKSKALFESTTTKIFKWILRYLHGTIEHGMLICRSSGSTLQAFTDVLWKGNPDTSLEAFSNADWAGDSDDRR